MGFSSFAGPLLLGVGPIAVVFIAFVARKAFLLLLALGRCVPGASGLGALWESATGSLQGGFAT